MASVTNQMFSADDGAASLSYTFDDVTLLISTLHLVNNSPSPICGALFNAAGTQVWSGKILPLGQTPNPPVTLAPGDIDVTALGIHMVSKVIFGRTQTVPPGSGTFSWPC